MLASSAEPQTESDQVFVAASSDLEKRLSEIWRDVLNRKLVGVHDDFFELGGNSLLALRLLARVEKVFGKKTSGRVRFSRPHRRADGTFALRTKPAAERCRHRGNPVQGQSSPLMLVHGAGGGMYWGYTALAQHLGENQPVYAFKSRGLDGAEEFASIEEMARHYIMELRAFQPIGPYYLGGYCFGGNVAYEMARQLHAQGETVALLALINCMPPNSSYDRVHFSAAFCAKFLKNLIIGAITSCISSGGIGGNSCVGNYARSGQNFSTCCGSPARRRWILTSRILWISPRSPKAGAACGKLTFTRFSTTRQNPTPDTSPYFARAAIHYFAPLMKPSAGVNSRRAASPCESSPARTRASWANHTCARWLEKFASVWTKRTQKRGSSDEVRSLSPMIEGSMTREGIVAEARGKNIEIKIQT